MKRPPVCGPSVRSWQPGSSLRSSRQEPHNLYSTDETGRAMRTSARQSNDGAKLQTPSRRPISLQSPKPIVQALSPSPPTFLRKLRQPKSFADEESLSASPKPASLRPDLGHL